MSPAVPARPTLFISDLHLAPEYPRPLALFERFLEEAAPAAGAVYILGDLFDAWVGDEELELAFHRSLAERLRKVVEAGTRVGFLHGNRDFLVGGAFAHASGAILLPDPYRLNLFGMPTLLTHGDQLCTDDTGYQDYRAQVRDPEWQREFLARPVDERRAIAAQLRGVSAQAKAGKPAEIMDVNPGALDQLVAQYEVRRIIHGHTHRPDRHTHVCQGERYERWVLPDWDEKGGYLHCDVTGCRLVHTG